VLQGSAGRYDERGSSDDFTQAGNLFRVMQPDAQDRLTTNIARAMSGVSADVRAVQIGHFTKADPAYGAAVARKLAALDAAAR
jgi:catalase